MPSGHPFTGFQAVILCGPGNSLYPFTLTGAEDIPKALLPIANKPMLDYPLEWCEKAGVKSPSSLEENLGTADVLRVAYRKAWITGDFVVLPCDFITNLDPQKVVELWMVEQAGFDADMGWRGMLSKTVAEEDGGRRGGLGVWYETKIEGAVKDKETDLLALALRPNAPWGGKLQLPGKLATLLITVSAQARASPTTSELLRRSLLRKHPNLTLLSTCCDAGIYFLPYWALEFIEKNPKMTSLRDDVIPWWSKFCWQNRRLAEKLGLAEIMKGSAEYERNNGDGVVGMRYDVGSMSSTRTAKAEKDKETTIYASRVVRSVAGGGEKEKAEKYGKKERDELEIPTVTAYLPTQQAFVRRVDTVQLYLYISLHLAKLDSAQPNNLIKVDPTATIHPSAVATKIDCLIAEHVTISAKAVVKKSVLGPGFIVRKGARLIRCVLMEGWVVGEGVRLEGCVIGKRAVVQGKVELKDCEVAHGFTVEEKVKEANECFVAFTGYDSPTDDGEIDTDPEEDHHQDSEGSEDLDSEDSEATAKPSSNPTWRVFKPEGGIIEES
ncbi:Translation initiation factor eIF-2B subunit gamma [Rhizina undulata]